MHGINYCIDKRAQITPNKIALIGENEQVTYKQMSENINQIALCLKEKFSIRKGDRIGLLLPNGVDYMMILFAAAKIGSIIVPLNTRLSSTELSFQMTDSQTTMLIIGKEFEDLGTQIINQTNISSVLWLDSGIKSFLEQVQPYPKEGVSVQEADGDSSFMICYTSGTTGRPKGAVLTQENMFWNVLNNQLALDITSNDVTITLLPLFHIGGIGLFSLPVLLMGGTVIIPSKFDPTQVLKLIEQYRVTLVMGVPTIHDSIRKNNNFNTTDFSSIRWFYSGGAPCPLELISFFHDIGLPFGQGYGMTETSPTVFMQTKENYLHTTGSIGKAAMFTDIRVVNSIGQDVGCEEVGELWVKGPNVFKEYWNLPKETADSFRDGWFLTGDLVKKDKNGFVYIAGRKKEMVISGGENIYPLEIEQIIMALNQVLEAAVIGVIDETWGEVPIAIIALNNGSTLTEKEIQAHCKKYLAKYKVPKQIHFVSVLPKNATGKIDKSLLKKQYTSRRG
ncbi:long-chain-fatty-acid--CoA ligase [Schinkia sp. CFF1]